MWYRIICTCILSLMLGNILGQSRGNKPLTIVIDAGHGGKDPGAVGKIHYEKDLALAIAQRLADTLLAYDSSLHIILTRRTDTFIELHQRAAIAQKAQGDFFISIHCNALRNRDRKGVETYILGLNEGQENYETIIAENEAMLFEKTTKKYMVDSTPVRLRDSFTLN